MLNGVCIKAPFYCLTDSILFNLYANDDTVIVHAVINDNIATLKVGNDINRLVTWYKANRVIVNTRKRTRYLRSPYRKLSAEANINLPEQYVKCISEFVKFSVS